MTDQPHATPADGTLGIEVHDDRPKYTLVHLRGELHGRDAETVQDQLHSRIGDREAAMIVDLSGLRTIDSGGLSQLISLTTHARLSQTRLVLASPTPFVAGVFATTRLNEWFDLADTLEQAEGLLGE